MSAHKNWHSRGYLPHFDDPNVIQAITFRLIDALPQARRLEILDSMSSAQKAERFQAVEDLLDSGRGSCILRDPGAAEVVQEALLHFDGQRYNLLAWVVMPNHVHVLVEMREGYPISKVVQSWKSFTANMINKALGRTGSLWQPDYFDRYVRNGHHLQQAALYIEYNPVRAKLVISPELWAYSSAALKR